MKIGTNSGLGAWGTGMGESFQKLYIVRHGFVNRSKKDEKDWTLCEQGPY